MGYCSSHGDGLPGDEACWPNYFGAKWRQTELQLVKNRRGPAGIEGTPVADLPAKEPGRAGSGFMPNM